MGGDIKACHAKIHTFMINYIKELAVGIHEDVMVGNQIWFLVLVLMILLVIGRAELNPEPLRSQGERLSDSVAHAESRGRE
jgi:hypothetical protein